MNIEEAFGKSPFILIDVRSPSEYQKGHIPFAHNIPLLDDEQRKKVGTLYKQKGFSIAFDKALAMVGPQMQPLVKQVRDLLKAAQLKDLETTSPPPKKTVLCYCWRGGLRSQSVTHLLQWAQIEAEALEGGYKSFRRMVKEQFSKPYTLKVIGGKTGSGKTEILAKLKTQGEAVIDLEAIAKHRGSAFGYQEPQPTQEHFENRLAYTLSQLPPQQTIWVEDENRLIGTCQIPKEFWDQMNSAPCVVIDIPLKKRIERLCSEYSQDHISLEKAIDRIKKRLGPERACQAKKALRFDTKEAAKLILYYYDKAYTYCLAGKPKKPHIIDGESLLEDELIKELMNCETNGSRS